MSETNKSVLVIDTPNTCRECILYDGIMNHRKELKHICQKWFPTEKGDVIQYYVDPDSTKPDWCPLSPLPEKRDLTQYVQRGDAIQDIYDSGWNGCLDAILKGERKE